MRRRRAPASASTAARRGSAAAAGGAAGREDRLLGLGRALGNRAMGTLLADGAGRERTSDPGLAAEKLDQWLDRVLREAGVEDADQRDGLRPRLRAAVESGSGGAVEAVIAAADLEPEVAETLSVKLANPPKEH